jgi:hypothetical protein
MEGSLLVVYESEGNQSWGLYAGGLEEWQRDKAGFPGATEYLRVYLEPHWREMNVSEEKWEILKVEPQVALKDI